MRGIAVAGGGCLAVAVAAVVVYGMVRGADPQFDRGRSPLGTVITQETVGALTLAVVVWFVSGLVKVARGNPAPKTPCLLIASLVLFVVWGFTFAVERAS